MGSLAGASMRRGRGSVDRRNSLASSQQSHHPHDAVSPSVARRRRTDVWRVIRRCCQKFSTSTGVVIGWREPADLADPRHTCFLRATTEVTLEPASGQLFGPADRADWSRAGAHCAHDGGLRQSARVRDLGGARGGGARRGAGGGRRRGPERARPGGHPGPPVPAAVPRHPGADRDAAGGEAAGLDVLSGGRFELGLGAGAFWDAIEAMGGPRRTAAEAVEALEEAIAIIRQAWSQERSVRLDGRHYQARGYHPGPAPAHGIEIWIGAYKPRMLRLIGRLADGWLPSVGSYLRPEALPAMQRIVDEAAAKAGRDPAEVRRMVNLSGSIAATGAEGISGGVDDWVDLLAGWATELGIDTFILWPTTPGERQVELFGAEVAPKVRAEVTTRRG